MTKDLHNNLKLTTSIVPAVKSSDTNGTGIDTAGYEAVEMVVMVGLSADTLSSTNKISLELEESTDNSTFTDVAEADMIGGISGGTVGEFALIDAATEDELTYKVGYRGTQRYIRPVLNFSGTHTTGTPIGAVAILGKPRNAPTSNTAA